MADERSGRHMGESDFSVDLRGKVAVVTGATGGIGASIASALARSGADVAVTDRRDKLAALSVLERSLRALGSRAIAIPADITARNDIDQVLGAVLNEFGAVDLLANVAGVYVNEPILEFTESNWDHLMQVNLKGPFLACQAFARAMVAQGSGIIINIASDSAIDVASGDGPYAASKAGLVVLSRHLARELGKHGIRVNAIAPGWVKTAMTEFVWQDPERLSQAVADIPMGYLADPAEIADVVLFLASSASGYLNGQLIVVNGGRV